MTADLTAEPLTPTGQSLDYGDDWPHVALVAKQNIVQIEQEAAARPSDDLTGTALQEAWRKEWAAMNYIPPPWPLSVWENIAARLEPGEGET